MELARDAGDVLGELAVHLFEGDRRDVIGVIGGVRRDEHERSLVAGRIDGEEQLREVLAVVVDVERQARELAARIEEPRQRAVLLQEEEIVAADGERDELGWMPRGHGLSHVGGREVDLRRWLRARRTAWWHELH